MTRTDLHSITGFHPASLLAAAAHLRTQMKRKPGSLETTTLVRNEGYMNGYLDAVDDLIAAASKQPDVPTEKKVFQPYSAPQPPNENQNK